jgi:hypothetical protein
MLRPRMENNIKMGLKEIRWGMDLVWFRIVKDAGFL